MIKNSSTTKLLISLDATSMGGGNGREREPQKHGSDQIAEINSLLKKAGIEADSRIVGIISENFKSKNRLISLFKLLKKCTISLTDTIYKVIAANISHIGSLVSLLDCIHELKIDPKYVKLEELFSSPFSIDNLITGLKQLNSKGYLDPVTIKLMFQYPVNAIELAEFIINLEQQTFSVDSIESKLNRFSKTDMGAALVLLAFALDKNLFYPDLLDILLRQAQYIDLIHEGAKKLALENQLSSTYFEVVENNSEDANTFAKNILLLSGASLIEYQSKADLLKVSRLGLGEFFFLSYLKSAELLNRETYDIVCQNHTMLSKEEVIDIFRKIPLFETFSRKELSQLINLMKQSDINEAEYNFFIEILSSHLTDHQQTTRMPGPGPTPAA